MSVIFQSDAAVRVCFGDRIDVEVQQRIQSLLRRLEADPLPAVVDIIPGFTTVTICYQPLRVLEAYPDSQDRSPYELMVQLLWQRLETPDDDASAREPHVVEIPVCYGGEYGPDLEHVARHCGLTPDEVVAQHSGADYLVYMIGFAPGFPYLGGLPPQLTTPRRDRPRPVIPAGSVGIAGPQTGVYPLSTPGGWQLIGRTATPLFLPERHPPCLLHAGDHLRFRPITVDEFRQQLQERGADDSRRLK